MFDVYPHILPIEWIVMTNARVFHNNEIQNNERTPPLPYFHSQEDDGIQSTVCNVRVQCTVDTELDTGQCDLPM